MIVSFKVDNFKSFPQDKTFPANGQFPGLDEVALKNRLQTSPGNSRARPNHISSDDCLKTIALFGNNSFGKSNFIKALKTLKGLVTDPFFYTDKPFHNWNSDCDETTFDIEFVFEGRLYEYFLVVAPNPTGVIVPICPGDDLTKPNPDRESVVTYGLVKEWLAVADYDGRHEPKKKEVFRRGYDRLIKNDDEYQNLLADNSEKRKDLTVRQLQYEEMLAYMKSVATLHLSTNGYLKAARMLIEKGFSLDQLLKIGFTKDQLMAAGFAEELEPDRYVPDDMVAAEKQAQEMMLKEIEGYPESEQLDNYITIATNAIQLQEEIEALTKGIEANDPKLFNALSAASCHPTIASVMGVKLDPEYDDNRYATNPDVVNVFRWFSSVLVIVQTNDFHLPLNRTDSLDKLSEVVSSMDVGISKLAWVDYRDKSDFGSNDASWLKATFGESDSKRLKRMKEDSMMGSCAVSAVLRNDNGLYRFDYWCGEESIQELAVQHGSDGSGFYKLNQESDGTRRIIELASMLLPTVTEKVYIVDEIDRRLHPLMTKHLIETFINDGYDNKQLIFTTHETRLLTTELFRVDEIWLVDKNDKGESELIPLDIIGKLDKRIDNMYLNGNLPGTPRFDE